MPSFPKLYKWHTRYIKMYSIPQNLLNADDDKEGSLTHKMNPLSAANRNPIQRPRSVASGVKDNNMLLQVHTKLFNHI